MASGETALNLEQIRKRSGVSIAAIAEATKISSRFLHAIESEDFEKLPGGVFNTSYIRQYASAIGYPERDLLDFYRSHLPRTEVLESPEMPPTRSWSLRACFDWLLNLSPAQRA
jgi:cytoskeletal protein RodZ